MRIATLSAHNPGAWTGAGNQTYLVEDDGHAALIDAGTGEPAYLDDLDAALAAGGRAGRSGRLEFGRVLVTHAHVDHASGAPELARRHPRVVFAKMPWPERDAQYHVRWESLADGQLVAVGRLGLWVVHTPGHAPDHVCFFEPASGTLFAGDLVANGSTVAVLASSGGDMAQYLSSLRRVLELQPRRILPAHGGQIDNPPALLRAYLSHRLMREQQVRDALLEGPDTVAGLVTRIYTGLDPALLGAAAESVLAHLVKLEREGGVAREAREDDAEVRWWRR